jgi:hypothetical protein
MSGQRNPSAHVASLVEIEPVGASKASGRKGEVTLVQSANDDSSTPRGFGAAAVGTGGLSTSAPGRKKRLVAHRPVAPDRSRPDGEWIEPKAPAVPGLTEASGPSHPSAVETTGGDVVKRSLISLMAAFLVTGLFERAFALVRVHPATKVRTDRKTLWETVMRR